MSYPQTVVSTLRPQQVLLAGLVAADMYMPLPAALVQPTLVMVVPMVLMDLPLGLVAATVAQAKVPPLVNSAKRTESCMPVVELVQAIRAPLSPSEAKAVAVIPVTMELPTQVVALVTRLTVASILVAPVSLLFVIRGGLHNGKKYGTYL